MILNGKAKDNFFQWWENKIKLDKFQYFKPREDVYLNALIIEWLDSVGIYINTTYEDYQSLNIRTWIVWINEYLLIDFKTRQEATKQAIIKANDIYNGL